MYISNFSKVSVTLFLFDGLTNFPALRRSAMDTEAGNVVSGIGVLGLSDFIIFGGSDLTTGGPLL